jgi:hypothetical protein
MKEVSVTSNFPDGAIFTRTAGYPEGLTVTVKAKMRPGYGFVEWQDEQSNQLTVNEVYSFTMGTCTRTFHAVLDNNPQNLDCAGKNNGTAYIDSCGDCVGGTSGKLPCVIDLPDDTFKIQPYHSGLCVQELSGVTQQTCIIDKSQLWIFTKHDNSYFIQNLASGLYLYSSSLTSGSYLSTGASSILWRIEKVNEGIYQLIPAANLSIAVDVYGARVTAGTQLLLYNRNSNNNQKFRIMPLTPVGIHKVWSNQRVEISPNPFSDETVITLTHGDRIPFDFILYNIHGIVISRMENNTCEELVVGTGLNAGIYAGKIIQGNEVWTVKLIKR